MTRPESLTMIRFRRDPDPHGSALVWLCGSGSELRWKVGSGSALKPTLVLRHENGLIHCVMHKLLYSPDHWRKCFNVYTVQLEITFSYRNLYLYVLTRAVLIRNACSTTGSPYLTRYPQTIIIRNVGNAIWKKHKHQMVFPLFRPILGWPIIIFFCSKNDPEFC